MLHLNRPNQCFMLWTTRLDGSLIRSRMANNTWGKLDHGLDLFAIFDRLADGEDGERLRDSQIDCAVCEDAARTDAAPKAEGNIVRIGFWFVFGRVEKTLWLED
jgi:hypothetical protein